MYQSLSRSFDVVVVAASLGGSDALRALLAGLPADFSASVVIVQHLGTAAPSFFPQAIGARSNISVQWARSGLALKPGAAYVAPPDHHLVVSRAARLRLTDGPRVNFVRPAADLLFTSAAEVFGPRTLGVILSGRLRDGAAGAMAIRRARGVVLAQAPETCRATGMPTAAIANGSAQIALPPGSLASAVISLVEVPGALDLFGLRRSAA